MPTSIGGAVDHRRHSLYPDRRPFTLREPPFSARTEGPERSSPTGVGWPQHRAWQSPEVNGVEPPVRPGRGSTSGNLRGSHLLSADAGQHVEASLTDGGVLSPWRRGQQ